MGEEILKTLDTEGIYYEVELDNLYDKALNAGWNWFSLNLTQDDMELNNVLSSFTTPSEGDHIKSQTQYADYYAEWGVWGGTLTHLNETSLYKISTGNSGNISFEGTIVDVASTPININTGWNWISFLPQDPVEINAALTSIDGIGNHIKNQTQYADFYPQYGNIWGGTMTSLVPHSGYMLETVGNGTLTYPESGLMLTESDYQMDRSTSSNNWNLDYRKFEYNSTVTIELDLNGAIPKENDQIGAFYNDECRGIAEGTMTPFNDKIIFYMMTYGNEESDELTFKYYDSQSGEVIDLVETITFVPDTHLNNAVNPYVMSNMQPLTYSLNDAYPNPFNPSTTIEYSIADDVNDLKIRIYDIRGRVVQTLHDGFMNKGEHHILWNASSFASGVYFVQMKTSNHVFNKKIMLIK